MKMIEKSRRNRLLGVLSMLWVQIIFRVQHRKKARQARQGTSTMSVSSARVVLNEALPSSSHSIAAERGRERSNSPVLSPYIKDPVNVDGSHNLIRNDALRFFWRTFVSPRESIRKLNFISKLSTHLAAPNNRRNVENGSYPSPPYGYGLCETEIVLLLRGSPRGMLDDILSSIDLDNTGIVTAIKLDLATSAIPPQMSMRDTLLFLAHQRGKKVVLPPLAFPSIATQLVKVVSAVVPPTDNNDASYSEEDKEDRFHYRRKLNDLVSRSQAMADNICQLDLFRFGCVEYNLTHDTVQIQLEALMMRGCGWGLVFGDAGVGKTGRILAACRSVLRQQLVFNDEEENDNEEEEEGGEDDDEVEEQKKVERERLGAPGGSVLYVDLRGAQSKGEVLAALAHQLGVTEGGGVRGAEEAEQRVVRMLGALDPGSVLVVNTRYHPFTHPFTPSHIPFYILSHTLLHLLHSHYTPSPTLSPTPTPTLSHTHSLTPTHALTLSPTLSPTHSHTHPH